MATERGHRVEPHTADVILHAWGPDVTSCFEEAATALLGICVDTTQATGVVHLLRREVAAGALDSMLLDLLDEVVFVLDTEPEVPGRVRVGHGVNGGLVAELEMVGRSSVVVVGSAPKAVSRSELSVEEAVDGVRCSFLVDV